MRLEMQCEMKMALSPNKRQLTSFRINSGIDRPDNCSSQSFSRNLVKDLQVIHSDIASDVSLVQELKRVGLKLSGQTVR
jgi:hypothetical protein